MWVGGQRHVPSALPPVKTRYPLCRRLGGPQSRSGQVRKISPDRPVGSRHSEWAIPAPESPTLPPLLFPYRSFWYPLDKILNGPHERSRHSVADKIFPRRPEGKLLFSRRPARSLDKSVSCPTCNSTSASDKIDKSVTYKTANYMRSFRIMVLSWLL